MLQAILGSASSPLAYTRAINAVFNKQRGLALGVALSGAGVAATFGPTLISNAIDAFGWRGAYYAMALFTLVVGAVIILVLSRLNGAKTAVNIDMEAANRDFLVAKASRTYWTIMAAIFCLSLGLGGLMIHFVPILLDVGFATNAAVKIAGVIGIAVAADSSASMAMLVTHISAAVGALTWMTIEWVKQGKATMIGIATGMVAGLATITPAAGSVGPAGALLIGVMAGYICFYATQAIKGYFYIDDSLDVFPVHGVGGMLGIIMISFLGSPDGFLGTGAAGIAEGGALVQLKAQLIGITVIAAWTGLATYLIIKAISVFTDIRVSEDVEAEGVDINEHNEQGYSF